MASFWKRHTASAAVAVAMLLGGCSEPEQGVKAPQVLEPSDDLVTMYAKLTAAQLDSSAQAGVNWSIADANTFTATNNCIGCHRQPVPLLSASISAYTGYQVNTSTANGTAYVAQTIATMQLSGGNWGHTSSNPAGYVYNSTAFSAFGLAGYSQYQSTAYLPNLQRGIDWAIANTAGYTFSFAMDGKALQGFTSIYMPADLDPASPSHAIGNHFTAPTGQMAVATRTALDVDNGLTPAKRTNYQNFLTQMANSLEGQYVRSAGGWKTEAVAYSVLGTLAADRTPTNNSSVQAMRDELLNRAAVGGGWGDTTANSPNPYSTAMALYALCRLEVRADQNTKVSDGLTWLANQQCNSGNNYCGTALASNDGSWNWAGHTNDVPTAFAVLAMGCYGSLNAQVTLSPISATLAAGLGTAQTTSFNVTVKNTGYVTNTYQLVPTGQFPSVSMQLSHNNPAMTLAPNGSATDVVTVQLPANLPPSVTIPVSVRVSYDTRSGPASKTVTFNIYIPPQPNASAAPTTTTILSPAAGAILAPGTTASLSAKVTLNATGATVTQGTLTLYAGGAAIATVVPDGSGNFAYNWPVPASALSGSQTFTATYNGYATANFSVNIAPSSSSRTITLGFNTGFTCSSNAQCQTGFCMDGVCCNSACGGGSAGDCQACSRLAGAASDGTCGTVQAAFICRQSQGFCDPEERCDGTSQVCPADAYSASGTACVVGKGSCNTVGQCVVPTKGLNADYYANTTLTGTASYSAVEPGSATITPLSFDYPWGVAAPNATTPADNFSTRWYGDIYTPVNPLTEPTKFNGRYWFYTQSDQGVRLWVNGKLIINNWTSHTSSPDSGSIVLEGGKRYSIVLEYYEGTGSANITLQYQPSGLLSSVIKTTYLDYAGATKTQLTPAINNPAPVRIKSPLDRSSYAAPATVVVDVEASAIGPNAVLQSVELFRNGVSQGTLTAAPFKWTQTGLTQNIYIYQAKSTVVATNSTGTAFNLVQYSAPVSIRVMPAATSSSTGQGLLADYFNGTNFNSFEFTRTDYTVFLDDTINNPLPPDILNTTGYTARWTGTVIPAYSQAYTFSVQANHPAKVWINNSLVIDTMANPGVKSSSAIGLSAGQLVPIKIEYYKNSATPTLMELLWESLSEPKAIIPGPRLYPATISTRP